MPLSPNFLCVVRSLSQVAIVALIGGLALPH
jgi:hypothetical protein